MCCSATIHCCSLPVISFERVIRSGGFSPPEATARGIALRNSGSGDRFCSGEDFVFVKEYLWFHNSQRVYAGRTDGKFTSKDLFLHPGYLYKSITPSHASKTDCFF